ncbi:hypothetical protein M427DRAFT_358284 [Gonapodya prolifera JEL478]|uniref:COX assembly mitochondrial protein n=1 Tax=Gonapodya prolifera (strain JEL478) TaxID=1344416 RepID=A0A139ABR0_GONPJ|nr:hypothetical protein M427DRAFT_358284 [Gonapodya prolifera JEL478]|eukprot:KXS13853.1 hypothetical protein M427DRAFT_358284 [Gonapodya prolifera JEL478]
MPHYEECNELYKELSNCIKSVYMAKLLDRCHDQEQALLRCMKKEYIKRKRESRLATLEGRIC